MAVDCGFPKVFSPKPKIKLQTPGQRGEIFLFFSLDTFMSTMREAINYTGAFVLDVGTCVLCQLHIGTARNRKVPIC